MPVNGKTDVWLVVAEETKTFLIFGCAGRGYGAKLLWPVCSPVFSHSLPLIMKLLAAVSGQGDFSGFFELSKWPVFKPGCPQKVALSWCSMSWQKIFSSEVSCAWPLRLPCFTSVGNRLNKQITHTGP